MPDQLFEHFALETTPPPVEEVRRRGERRRRRTAAAVAAGSVAAVVAVAAPVAVLADGHRGAHPSPAHSNTPRPESHAWVTTIPRSFDLTAGMATNPAPHQQLPTVPGPGSGEAGDEIDVCGAPVWRPSDAAQVLQASWTDGAEGTEQRTLATYPSGLAADAAAMAIATAVRGCPAIPSLRPTSLGEPTGRELGWVEPSSAGAASDGTGTAYVVLVRNNTLVIDRANMTSAGDAQARLQTLDHLLTNLEHVAIAAYTSFPGADGSGPEAGLGGIPGDLPLRVAPLPLGKGWDGNGPDASVTAIPPLRMCATLAWSGPFVGHLGWRRWAATDQEVREVRSYLDESAAQHELTVLGQAATACQRDTGGGATTTWSVLERSQDSVALVGTYPTTPGRTTYLFTRVGRAILAFAYSGDIAPGDALARLTAAGNKIAPGLCRMTSHGCPKG